MANRIVAALAGIALAVTLVGAGFAAVAIPDTATQLLAERYAGTDNPRTAFTTPELVAAAVAGKHYTFDDNDADALRATVRSINESAHADGRAPDAAPDLDSPRTDERYVLPADAMSHLDDVYRTVRVAKPALAAVAVAAVAGLAWTATRGGRRALGAVLAGGGSAVLAAFAALGAWAALDFNGLFAAFHGLFFAAGTWTFANDSLLITMYPTAFWMGMGMIWLAVTCGLSILACIVGIVLRRR